MLLRTRFLFDNYVIKTERDRDRAERALDQALVDMVTRNPSLSLRWDDRVGSIEAGKVADLLLVRRATTPSTSGLPASPYRSLIEAAERDVRLVLVGGEPLAGDVALMEDLKPGDNEVVDSEAGEFHKAIERFL